MVPSYKRIRRQVSLELNTTHLNKYGRMVIQPLISKVELVSRRMCGNNNSRNVFMLGLCAIKEVHVPSRLACVEQKRVNCTTHGDDIDVLFFGIEGCCDAGEGLAYGLCRHGLLLGYIWTDDEFRKGDGVVGRETVAH